MGGCDFSGRMRGWACIPREASGGAASAGRLDRGSGVSLSRVDTALKQLGQIREYERRLKGLEKEVRTWAWQRGTAGMGPACLDGPLSS